MCAYEFLLGDILPYLSKEHTLSHSLSSYSVPGTAHFILTTSLGDAFIINVVQMRKLRYESFSTSPKVTTLLSAKARTQISQSSFNDSTQAASMH